MACGEVPFGTLLARLWHTKKSCLLAGEAALGMSFSVLALALFRKGEGGWVSPA